MMNANLPVGTAVVLTTNDHRQGVFKRYGSVCESGPCRLRIKWERQEHWKDGELKRTGHDTKRTWIKCDRLRVVPTYIDLPDVSDPPCMT